VIFTTSSPPVNAVQKSQLAGHLAAYGILRFPRFVACLQRRRGGAVSLQRGGASLDVEASRPKNSHFGPDLVRLG
jgi:hypothetical protein